VRRSTFIYSFKLCDVDVSIFCLLVRPSLKKYKLQNNVNNIRIWRSTRVNPSSPVAKAAIKKERAKINKASANPALAAANKAKSDANAERRADQQKRSSKNEN
jgi:hypothetical protein